MKFFNIFISTCFLLFYCNRLIGFLVIQEHFILIFFLVSLVILGSSVQIGSLVIMGLLVNLAGLVMSVPHAAQCTLDAGNSRGDAFKLGVPKKSLWYLLSFIPSWSCLIIFFLRVFSSSASLSSSDLFLQILCFLHNICLHHLSCLNFSPFVSVMMLVAFLSSSGLDTPQRLLP